MKQKKVDNRKADTRKIGRKQFTIQFLVTVTAGVGQHDIGIEETVKEFKRDELSPFGPYLVNKIREEITPVDTWMGVVEVKKATVKTVKKW